MTLKIIVHIIELIQKELRKENIDAHQVIREKDIEIKVEENQDLIKEAIVQDMIINLEIWDIILLREITVLVEMNIIQGVID